MRISDACRYIGSVSVEASDAGHEVTSSTTCRPGHRTAVPAGATSR